MLTATLIQKREVTLSAVTYEIYAEIHVTICGITNEQNTKFTRGKNEE